MTDLIFPTADNPIPENAKAGMVTTRDGKRLRYARFGATARPIKGTVLILTGRNECIEKYYETVRELGQRGFGAVTFDWRGQGGSDRLTHGTPRGYVERFEEYVADVEAFFEDVVLPDCRAPFYLLGHSTGSLIALMAAPILSGWVRRMVLVAPLLEFRGMPLSMTALRHATGLLFALGLGRMFMATGGRRNWPAPFATNKLTSDAARYARNLAIYEEHPELATGRPTVAWIHAACRAAQATQDLPRAPRLAIPTLIVAAGADEVVATGATEFYARRVRGASIITIDGARHEILQEADIFREQFWAAFDAFIPGSEDAEA